MPMRLAGWHRKYRRNGQEIGAGLRKRAVEMREAHIVADRHPEPAPRGLGDDGPAARTIGVALAVALAARQIDVEHVDLVVAGDDRALGIDQEGPVGEPLLPRIGAGLAGWIDHE